MISKEESLAALTKIQHVYPAPGVLAQASHLVRDPNTDVNDLVKLVRTDSSLTADIIRISNSAYYGCTADSTNLAASLAQIGFREVMKIISLSISKNVLNQPLVPYQLTAEDFWARGVSTAVLLEKISERIGRNPQDAYTIGVLHEVGRMAVRDVMAMYKKQANFNAKEKPLEAWEEETVGACQAELGSELLKKWGFPDDFYDIVRYQANPEEIAEPHTMLLSLNLTQNILGRTGHQFQNVSAWDFPTGHPFMERMKIEQQEIQKMVEQSAETFRALRQVVQGKGTNPTT